MKTPEQTDIEWIKSALRRIEDRISSLEAFKWKVLGVSGGVIFLVELIYHAK